MTSPTFEEAKRCPKCDKPGEEVRVIVHKDLPRGAKLHEIFCRTELCRWYNTPWMVQTNADGSVPPPTDHTGRDKKYVGFEGHDEMAARIRANVEAERKAQTEPGGMEVRNPFSR